MRFITIYGGPRPRGNTETVLGWVEDALRASGHEVTRFDLARLDVRDCTSCYACFESMDAPGCVVEDDAQALFDAMCASDGIVFASPLYMWGIAGALKSLFDRTCCLVRGFLGPEHTSFIEQKPATMVVTCMGPEAENADLVAPFFDRWSRYTKVATLGTWVVPGCSEPSALPEDVRRRAVDLASKLCG